MSIFKRSSANTKHPTGNKAKKRLSGRAKAAIALVLLILVTVYSDNIVRFLSPAWRWINNIGYNPNYRLYKNFNIHIPTNYKIHGIDVSSYQGRIDWQKVKKMKEDSVHISFAFIKATEGVNQVDLYFERNWREAPNAGVICGAYHYFRPKLNGKLQATFFLQNVKTKKGQLPLTVDIEELDGASPEQMRHELDAFLKEIKTRENATPIIYTGLKFYQDNLAGHFDTYPLWVAHYYEPELHAREAAKWKFWQHSDKAKVNGIYSHVDFDVFSGDSLAFKKLLLP